MTAIFSFLRLFGSGGYIPPPPEEEDPPLAPSIVWTSDTDVTSPTFDSTGDFQEGDTVRIQYSTASDFSTSTSVTNIIDATEDAANALEFTGEFEDGTYYFRVRIERPTIGNSDWSETISIVIDTSSSGGTPATWNPSDSLNVILSGGDLTAEATAPAGVRSTSPVATNQKVYYEITPVFVAANQMYGFANASQILNSQIGQIAATSFGCNYDGTYLDFNSADHNSTIPSYTQGDRIDIAYDDAAKLFWMRVTHSGSTSDWNGDSGANPATGTGGMAVAVTGTFYAYVNMGYATEISTVTFASADWVGIAPSGFTQLAS